MLSLDSDELPTIFPPKRRRTMIRPRLNIQTMSAFADNKRIIQEFPKHNWLPKKYMGDPSLPAQDFKEVPSEQGEKMKDEDKLETVALNMKLPHLEKSQDGDYMQNSSNVDELMDCGPPKLERVGDIISEPQPECEDEVVGSLKSPVLEAVVELSTVTTACKGKNSLSLF